MSERNDYHTLRTNVFLPRHRVDRIENALTVGMPDVNYCIDGVEGWLEIKSPTEPKRTSTPLFGSNHKVSQSQMNWFVRQRLAGGVAFLLIATDKRWMLIDGAHADEVNGLTIFQLHNIAIWSTSKPVLEHAIWGLLREALACR